MTKRFLAIIPARGGSKGLPKKNILDLAGKPLIAWTIEASLEAKKISKTVVSSDNHEILELSKTHGADILIRPEELSTDTASSESVIEHALNHIEGEYDYVVLLQPTSPLRSSKDIDKAIDKMVTEKASALISVYEVDNKLLKTFKYNDNGYLESISNDQYPFMRRQELPKVFMPNGAIYIINIDEFNKCKSLLTHKTASYVMDNRSSLDIDSQADLDKAIKAIKDSF